MASDYMGKIRFVTLSFNSSFSPASGDLEEGGWTDPQLPPWGRGWLLLKEEEESTRTKPRDSSKSTPGALFLQALEK